jgi:hypothetical protein
MDMEGASMANEQAFDGLLRGPASSQTATLVR